MKRVFAVTLGGSEGIDATHLYIYTECVNEARRKNIFRKKNQAKLKAGEDKINKKF